MGDDPRERARRRDNLLWTAVTVVVAALTGRYAWQIAGLAVDAPSVGEALPVAVVGILIVAVGAWLAVGAWRRTDWR